MLRASGTHRRTDRRSRGCTLGPGSEGQGCRRVKVRVGAGPGSGLTSLGSGSRLVGDVPYAAHACARCLDLAELLFRVRGSQIAVGDDRCDLARTAAGQCLDIPEAQGRGRGRGAEGQKVRRGSRGVEMQRAAEQRGKGAEGAQGVGWRGKGAEVWRVRRVWRVQRVWR
eukprot:scaffold79954_cov54-Phaeocystis_antarctica.AAC.4